MFLVRQVLKGRQKSVYCRDRIRMLFQDSNVKEFQKVWERKTVYEVLWFGTLLKS